MADNTFMYNMMTEILYKGSSSGYDSFLGPWNIVSFLGNNMNPPLWSVPARNITDMGKFIFGEKTFG